MQHTNIEWCRNSDGSPGYTSNPVKGLCPVACPYCYARAIYRRFKWDERIRFEPDEFKGWHRTKAGSRVFVGSMIDLFHRDVNPAWVRTILEMVKLYPDRTFMFLTKQPQNLAKFSPFPANAWVGVSVTDTRMALTACLALQNIEVPVKYLSIEPMLHPVNLPADFLANCGISWVICGAQTQPTVLPKREWVEDLERSCGKAGIPVFEKESLKPLFPERELRREWPR